MIPPLGPDDEDSSQAEMKGDCSAFFEQPKESRIIFRLRFARDSEAQNVDALAQWVSTVGMRTCEDGGSICILEIVCIEDSKNVELMLAVENY